MISVWSGQSSLPSFERLNGDVKTDVLVIGGGLAGILCAYKLKEAGIDCALVEASTICSGITKNTTAKITSQHGIIYDKLIREFGMEKARMYLSANEKAVNEYRTLCENIDCDFQDMDSYVYSLDNGRKVEKELTALCAIGYSAELSTSLPLPFEIAGAVKFKNQAQFNPLKFVSSIVGDLKIYEHTQVREIAGKTAFTRSGKITAEKFIVATHFPFINKYGGYFIKMYQHRSYVIAVNNAPDVNGMYMDENEKGMSFRNYRDLLLVGGAGHRTGKQGGAWRELQGFIAANYPDAREQYRWATQDCMTLDGAAYIGKYCGSFDNVYVATGFNKWGMTSSMVSADILTDMISGRRNENAEVFNPSRTVLRPKLALNVLESAAGLITPSKKRCPHLGCVLKWNPNEHSWDCPCHGSRFTEDGKIIDNPATGDLKS